MRASGRGNRQLLELFVRSLSLPVLAGILGANGIQRQRAALELALAERERLLAEMVHDSVTQQSEV